MDKSKIIMPDGEFPSLEDFKSGNMSDEWKQHYENVWNAMSPWLREMIADWSKVKNEALMLLEVLHKSDGFDDVENYLKNNPPSAHLVIHLLLQHEEQLGSELRSNKGRFAAQKKHEKTNAAKEIMKEFWTSGKYTSRDICAEQEAAGLNLSFSTARKALRNTPNNS